MPRKKNDTEQAVKSSKKKYSAIEKKRYVMEHLGTTTYEAMASKLECTEKNIYGILRTIRAERELIHADLVANSAEEQYNRLNTACRLSFSNLMKGYDRLQKRVQDDKGNWSDPFDEKDLWMLSAIHDKSERTLTQFMKAVGLYNPDVNIQNIENLNQGVTVVFASGMKDKKTEREVNPKD